MLIYRAMCKEEYNRTIKYKVPDFRNRFKWFSTNLEFECNEKQADWKNKHQRKYCISYNNTFKKHMYEIYTESKFINSVFMSQDNAKKLCKLLNDGIVSF